MPKTTPAYPEPFRREGPWGRSIPDVAGSLWVSARSLHNWKRQDDRDCGERDDGLTSAERVELRKRVKRLEQERDILKRAAALFASVPECARSRRVGSFLLPDRWSWRVPVVPPAGVPQDDRGVTS